MNRFQALIPFLAMAVWVSSSQAQPSGSASESPPFDPHLALSVTATHACVGGARPNEGCSGDMDCYGRCVGGGAPGETCVGVLTADCRGRCSGNHNFRCSFTTECQCQGLGRCDSPAPGTCTNPPPGSCREAVSLAWTAIPDAVAYDAVEGDLATVNGGDFDVTECLANDTPSVSVMTFDPASPRWFLIRGVYASSNGTYDEGGSQVGSRDPVVSCP